MIAIASSSTFSAIGTRLPSIARMPRAKAMSVAAGMAHPARFAGTSLLMRMKIAAGAAMPPIAANTGRLACDHELSCPVRTSRFTSRPTRKKKTAISPSLTQCSSDLSMPNSPMLMATGTCQSVL